MPSTDAAGRGTVASGRTQIAYGDAVVAMEAVADGGCSGRNWAKGPPDSQGSGAGSHREAGAICYSS